MKGDFSRLTFDPAAHRAAVLQQQGRVQLDADWNEEAAIQLHRWRAQTVDTVGACGAPEHDAGFQVAAAGGPGISPALTLTPGRAYVDGLLCELETPGGRPLDYMQQPYDPHPEPLGLDGLGFRQQRTDVVYLRAWLRHVSALEDPSLLEPALGGPDTATRLATVWQVRLIKDVGGAVDCSTLLRSYDALTAPSGGRLTTGTVAIPSATDPCLVNPQGGYSGLENQLYRVEIHGGGLLGTATFKWSRDNASIGERVEAFVDGTHVQVESLGRDAYTQFRIGQWVEVLGDAAELDDGRGVLAKIVDLGADRVLALGTDVSAIKGQANARVRRWDMADGVTPPQADGTLATAAGPITLENGVTVSFAVAAPGAQFLVGDYWVFAARVAGGSANGPSVEQLTQAPPLGIRHHFCRLAVVTWTNVGRGVISGQVQQCMPLFPPLTELLDREGCCTVVGAGPNLAHRLQAALDAVAAPGGCVCLAAGDYVLDAPLVIRRARRVTFCGCAGAVRLLWSGTAAAALTIAESQRVTVCGVSLYGSGAPALVAVESSQDVEVRDGWLVNLPQANLPAVCVTVSAGTNGVTLARCNLLGDAAVMGGPASFANGAPGGVLDVAVERCRLLARVLGVFLPAVQGLRVQDGLVAGLPADTWKQLQAAGAGLSASGLPPLDAVLAGLFHAQPTTDGMVPAGVLALSAQQVRVARNQVCAGIAFAGVAVGFADFADNLAVTLIGWLTLSGSAVTIKGNFIRALLLGIGGAGVSAGWQVGDNDLAGGNGVVFSPGATGRTLLGRAVAALAGGLTAFAVGPDAVAMKGFAAGAVTGEGGAALSRLLAPQVDDAVARLAGNAGLAQSIVVAGNAVAASGQFGIAVAAGVRTTDVRICANRVDGAQAAGISLMGEAAGIGVPRVLFGVTAAPTETGSSGVLVEGNAVTGSGLGIAVETAGTTVAGNTVSVVSAGDTSDVQNHFIARLQPLFQALPATRFVADAAVTGDVRAVRTGFDQLALRVTRGDLSQAEAGAVATEAGGPLAAALDAAQLPSAADNLRAFAAALQAGDLATAATHLAVVEPFVTAALGGAGIRLAASDVAAKCNGVFALGADRGGIWIDVPSGANVVVNPDGSAQALHTVAVRDNLISGGAGHGVEVGAAVSGLRITGNEIRDMTGCGVFAINSKEGLAEVEIAHNRVEDCVGASTGQERARAGIAVSGAQELSIVDNGVLRCGANQPAPCFGIEVAVSTDVSLRGNTVLQNGGSIAGGNRLNGGIALGFCRGSLLLTANRCTANQDSALVVLGQQVNPPRQIVDSTLVFFGQQADPSRLTVTGNFFDAPGGPFESINVTAGNVIFSLNQVAHGGAVEGFATRIAAANAAAVLGNIWEVQPPVLPLPDPVAAPRFTVIGNVTDDTPLSVKVTQRDQSQVNNVPHPTT